MKVSAWKAASYGIRLSPQDRTAHFNRKWKYVMIEINGINYKCNLSKTFWTTCPEIRKAEIGKWLISKGHSSWPRGHPPKYTLNPKGGNKFVLK